LEEREMVPLVVLEDGSWALEKTGYSTLDFSADHLFPIIFKESERMEVPFSMTKLLQ
jgi:hypothetical protein